MHACNHSKPQGLEEHLRLESLETGRSILVLAEGFRGTPCSGEAFAGPRKATCHIILHFSGTFRGPTGNGGCVISLSAKFGRHFALILEAIILSIRISAAPQPVSALFLGAGGCPTLGCLYKALPKHRTSTDTNRCLSKGRFRNFDDL